MLWRILAGLGVALGIATAAPAQEMRTSAGAVTVSSVVRGLNEPWSLGFLPDGAVLITERGGQLLHVVPGEEAQRVRGVPEVFASGQGGLFDVLVPRDFAQSREVFLSYAKPQGRNGAGTAVAVGTLSDDGARLQGVRDIFESAEGFSGGRHFGGRLVEAPDGALFLTTGDRGDRPSSQDRSNHNGAVIRILRDGSVPADNPFVGRPDIQPEIWSYGHRNPQGADLDAQGRLWTHEHGARGGDEINAVTRGANYGWPVISYGRHYSGRSIGQGTSAPGMEQPAFYWDPSIAPSGFAIYSGRLWPEWEGDLFVGSLKFGYIARLDGSPLREAEQIESAATGRVRDIREAPDGSLWFLSVADGAAYRMAPAPAG